MEYKYVTRVLTATGLIIPSQTGTRLEKALHLTRAVLMTSVVSTYMIYDVCASIFDDDPLAFSQIVYSFGAARTVVSMIFFLYWQHSGILRKVWQQLHETSNLFAASTIEKGTRRDKYLCVCLCCFVGAYFLDELQDVMEVLRGERPEQDLFQDPFGLPYGYCLWTFVMWYQTAAGYAVLTLQLTGVYALRDLFEEHNQQLRRIGVSLRQSDARDHRSTRILVDALQQTLKKQLSLLKALATFNQCFKGTM